MDQVPAGPIRRLVEEWAKKHPDLRELAGPKAAGCLLGNSRIIAHLTDLPLSFIQDLRGGRYEELPFDKADRIVTRLSERGGMGWFQNEELSDIYWGFDLASLDASAPTTGFAA